MTYRIIQEGIRPCAKCGIKDAKCVVEVIPGGTRRRCLKCGTTKRVCGYPR